jgi:hypothetical protein
VNQKVALKEKKFRTQINGKSIKNITVEPLPKKIKRQHIYSSIEVSEVVPCF